MALHTCKQEARLAALESNLNGQNHDIQNLVRRLDKLTSGIWALVLTLIPTLLGLFGFLIWQVLKK